MLASHLLEFYLQNVQSRCLRWPFSLKPPQAPLLWSSARLRLGPLASPSGHSVPRPCRGGGPSPAWLSGPAVLPSPLQPHHLSLPVLHMLWAGRPCCLSWPVLLQSSPSSYAAPPGWRWRFMSLSPEPQSNTGGGLLRVGGRGPQPVPVVALSKVSIGGPLRRARKQQGRFPRTMGRGGVTVSFTGSLAATAQHKSNPVPSQPAWVLAQLGSLTTA